MSIKYPVRIRELDTTYESRMGGWKVVDGNGRTVCEKESKEDAAIIADSLNAVNEFPELSDDNMDLIKWFNKYRHLLERDDG